MIGAGDGVGGAIAKAFAAEGMAVCVTRRARNMQQLEALAEGIRKTGHPNVYVVDKEEDMVPLVRDMAHTGDLVIGLGAGTITDWSYALPDLLSGAPTLKVAAGGAH